MLLKIRHGIIALDSHPFDRTSAIIINNEVVIAPASLLNVIADEAAEYLNQLETSHLIRVQEADDNLQSLSTLQFEVTFDQNKFNSLNGQFQRPHFLARRATLLYIYNSKDILHFFSKLMSASIDMTKKSKVLLSSFLVLTIDQPKKYAFENLLLHIAHYLSCTRPIRTLDDILVVCSPFGLEEFYKTVSISKVSNVIGNEKCLFVLSNSLPAGCEGSSVVNSELRLIGIIVSTCFRRQEENVQMTLAANFSLILNGFMRQLGLRYTTLTMLPKQANFPWQRTLVLVQNGGNQGTGTLLKILNRKLILTCSHVVSEMHSKVVCRNFRGVFESNVVWRNNQRNRAFDMALLSVPMSNDSMNKDCARLSNCKPIVGQTVYNAGFPSFISHSSELNPKPSIFQGRVIKCSPGLIVSDGSVQSGQSGGPMFDQHGAVLGICVSNIKVNEYVYPNINKAVPVSEIRQTLESFAKTNDSTILDQLIANAEIQNIWAMNAMPTLSKL